MPGEEVYQCLGLKNSSCAKLLFAVSSIDKGETGELSSGSSGKETTAHTETPQAADGCLCCLSLFSPYKCRVVIDGNYQTHCIRGSIEWYLLRPTVVLPLFFHRDGCLAFRLHPFCIAHISFLHYQTDFIAKILSPNHHQVWLTILFTLLRRC